ncbi:hypothetical protein HPP92_012812 [Vanilla planifolia]|nr:hypothetical protein HPP92_012812 [Vanilla planifolia]
MYLCLRRHVLRWRVPLNLCYGWAMHPVMAAAAAAAWSRPRMTDADVRSRMVVVFADEP